MAHIIITLTGSGTEDEGTSVYRLIRSTFRRSQYTYVRLTPEKSRSRRTAWNVTVTHPRGDDDDDTVLLYVHRNRRLIRDGSPGRLPRLSHSS